MKRLTLLSFCSLFIATLSAQLDTYPLSEYLYPDIERQFLEINPDINISGNKFSFQGVTNTHNNNSSIGLGATWSIIKNSRKDQENSVLRAGMDYIIHNKVNTQSSYSNVFSGFVDIDFDRRFFLKPKRFIEIGANANYRDAESFINNEVFSLANVDVRGSPKFGFGRLEIVTDAWHAINILKNLQAEGLLKEELSHDEITALSEKISQLKNVRQLDLRFENIYEFEQLATYLIENDFVDPGDYRMFAVLKDGYDFEGFRVRQNGTAIKFGPDVGFFYNESSPDNSFKDQTYGFAAELDIDKAINLKWQFDQSYLIRGGQSKKSFSNISNIENNFVGFIVRYTVGYYMNRRTNFDFSSWLYFNEDIDSSISSSNLNLNLSGTYYVSPAVRLNVATQLSTNSSDDNSINISEGTSYYIIGGVRYFLR